MTIAASNGSTRPHPIHPDVTNLVNPRPDRNTLNGREPNVQPPLEEYNDE